MVSEVCARGHGAGRGREQCPRGEERLVDRSAAGAAVGVAKEEPIERAEQSLCYTTVFRLQVVLVRVLLGSPPNPLKPAICTA